MTKVAMCKCGEPLVCTLVYNGYEFVCVHCGKRYGWLEPDSSTETSELLERVEKNTELWQELSKNFLSRSGMRRDCMDCRINNEPHIKHCSPEELADHYIAKERMAAQGLPV